MVYSEKSQMATSTKNAEVQKMSTNLEKPDNYSNGKDWKIWKNKVKAQKRKWNEEKVIKRLEKQRKTEEMEEVEENKNTGSPKVEERFTVSIAVPGSILDNAQSAELRTYLGGQIARAAVVFNIDEIIVFDENKSLTRSEEGNLVCSDKRGEANLQLARILQYLECPQYLRKALFPQQPDLKYAGLLNPLDCPHHMRINDICEYREGVVLHKPVKEGKGSFVDIGLPKNIDTQIDRQLQPGLRVTVKLRDFKNIKEKKKCKGTVVSPSVPNKESGLYWGYSVRIAKSFSEIFTGSPYDDGYDCFVGTSERGDMVDDLTLPTFEHLLILFGGVNGLESVLEADEDLQVDDPRLLLHHYINVCPNQGSRTIRTEEAILIALSALRHKVWKNR